MMANEITLKQRNKSETLQRFAENDRITDSINTYGDLIWSIASGLTKSPEEAENVVREIFFDLWQETERAVSTDFDEIIFISIIARRHLMARTIKNQPIN